MPIVAYGHRCECVNLGIKFTATQVGEIVGCSYYKGISDTGSMWAPCGAAPARCLPQATFSNKSLSGWQTVTFSNPVAISPGTPYVVELSQ